MSWICSYLWWRDIEERMSATRSENPLMIITQQESSWPWYFSRYKFQNQFTGLRFGLPLPLLVSLLEFSEKLWISYIQSYELLISQKTTGTNAEFLWSAFLPPFLLGVTCSHFGHPIKLLTFNHPMSTHTLSLSLCLNYII